MDNLEKIIEEHESLVHSIIQHHGISLNHPYYPDLLQEGKMAIIEALQTWDSKKAKLSTYAFWLIRRNVQKGIMQIDTIRFASYDGHMKHRKEILSMDKKRRSMHYSDNNSLHNVLTQHKPVSGYSDEQIEMLHKAIDSCNFTQRQKKKLKLWMDRDKEHQKFGSIQNLLDRIKYKIRGKYGRKR